MSVTNVDKNTDTLTMTITSEFDAPVERVWEMWSNPRLLEKWWGPPTWPATVVDHDLKVGGTITYFMTGPEGDKAHGWWRVTAVDAPKSLEFEDGFSDDTGTPNPDMPVTKGRVTLEDAGSGRTRMTIASTFASREDMDQLTTMGMDEGMKQALNQIDALLEAG